MAEHIPYRTYRRRRIVRKRLICVVAVAVVFAVMLFFGWLIDMIGNGSRPGVYTIAVDAGHGGSDTGAIGVIRECDMTAQTAQLLTNLLDADPHFRTAATRQSYEDSATPAERSAAANRSRADLFLSIHGNSDGGAGNSVGFECYPVTPGRAEHEDSVRFASCLVAQMSDAGATIRGIDGMRYAYYDDNDQKTIVESSDDSTHRENTFTVLERSRCPAVLAEQCFVTSYADVDSFGDDDGCALSADCYYRAICDYFGVTPYGYSDSSSAQE